MNCANMSILSLYLPSRVHELYTCICCCPSILCPTLSPVRLLYPLPTATGLQCGTAGCWRREKKCHQLFGFRIPFPSFPSSFPIFPWRVVKYEKDLPKSVGKNYETPRVWQMHAWPGRFAETALGGEIRASFFNEAAEKLYNLMEALRG